MNKFLLILIILPVYFFFKKKKENFDIEKFQNTFWDDNESDPSGELDYLSWDKPTSDAVCNEQEYDLYGPDDSECAPLGYATGAKAFDFQNSQRYTDKYEKYSEQPWFDNLNKRQNFYPEYFYTTYQKDGVKVAYKDRDLTKTPRTGKGKTCLNKFNNSNLKTFYNNLPSTQKIQCKRPYYCEYKTSLGGENYTNVRPIIYTKISGNCDSTPSFTN